MEKQNLIITIGRENGSGGRYIGEKLAKKLGIKCYDGELITETATQSGMDSKFIRQHEERRPESRFYFGGQAVPMQLVAEQSKVIEEIARRESCVFIGRCADYVLREHKNLVNVFVHAPLGSRIERVCRRENKNVIEAEKIIHKTDKERSSYYHFYTRQIWGDCRNYHITLDTSLIGIEASVQMIYNYVEMRNHEDVII